MQPKYRAIATLAITSTLLLTQMGLAQEAAGGAREPGTVTVPQFTLPYSGYGSPQARADFELRRNEDAAAREAAKRDPSAPRAPSDHAPWIIRALAAQRQAYPAAMTDATIGGVPVRVFVPSVGIPKENESRVLINLHGGGFTQGWELGSQIESLPFATIGRVKVISVNYRMAPKHHFPAASEDVGNVYQELLKTHKPTDIAIYGCSAGGILGPQSVSWIQSKGLPSPAALAVFSGSVSRITGDSMYFSQPFLGSPPPGVDPERVFQAASGGYFSGTSPTDPLVWPTASKEVARKFPPTLLSTGARGPEMSATLQSHLDLTNAGVDARLYLWDGVGHCFIYNPELPESQQLYAIASKFFKDAMDKK